VIGREFYLFQNFDAGSAVEPTQPAFPGVKWPVCEVNSSPPFCAVVKNERSCTSVPPVYLHGVHRDKFTFLFV
jgi:hypothetical protein